MITDMHGNPVSGASGEAVAWFNQAVEAFSQYRGDPLAFLDRAIGDAPRFAMAHLMKTHLMALATEPEASKAAMAILEDVTRMPLTERESSHAAILGRLLAGEWSAAALALNEHNARFPHDFLAIQCGHLVDFYRANARELRDRIARVLPYWSAGMPGYSMLLGLYAFGLEETGDYARAEDIGRRALDLQPLDCWAHHAVAHVMEMQGRAEDGIGWMVAREPFWSGEDSFFKIHNWWHLALCHLNLGQAREALALYDGPIREQRSAVALDMVDASALLWRLCLSGHEVGDRWQELAAHWDNHADGRSYPFNDWHAVMAYLGAGRDGDVARILRGYRENSALSPELTGWGRQVVVPLIEGFTAFWQGEYALAAAQLHGARHISNVFGGSHAQRDIIDWTSLEAALRGGLQPLAEALANERLALRPHLPVNRSFLSRSRAGDTVSREDQAA